MALFKNRFNASYPCIRNYLIVTITIAVGLCCVQLDSVEAATTCEVIKTACSCRFENGSIIDLSPLAKTDGTAK